MKLISILINLLVLIAFANCSKGKAQLDPQLKYLESKVRRSLQEFENLNLETGNTPACTEFVKISVATHKRIEKLLSELPITDSELDSKIEEIIKGTEYKYDTIYINSQFLYEVVKHYKKSPNADMLNLSLILFNLEVIERYRSLFDSYHYHLDILSPIAVLKSFEVKRGEFFEGLAKTDARKSSLSFTYELNNPQDNSGFIELPKSVKWNNDGKIKIKATKLGKHTVKLRSKYWENGKEVKFENEFEIEVIE